MNNVGWICSIAMMSVALCLVGCREDPGTPDYSGRAGRGGPMFPDGILEGPDPYIDGEERLQLGAFYEGGRSEEIIINGETKNYFVFVLDLIDLVPTFADNLSMDRVEGERSYEVTLTGKPFWGGGLIWEVPIDLSGWTTLVVSFKSSDASFAAFDLTLQSGEGEEPNGVVLDPTDYGYAADGEWHTLEIPLQNAISRGWDIRNVRSPFIIGAAGGEAGDILLIDNLYMTKD